MAEKQSLGTMISGVTEDLSTLIRGEIELVKTEARQSMQVVSRGGGMLAAAGVTAFLAVVFLLLTLAWVLVQLGLPTWAGFGIVTLLLIIVATILGLVGKKQLEQVKGLERSQASIEETKALLSRTPLPVTDGLDGPA